MDLSPNYPSVCYDGLYCNECRNLRWNCPIRRSSVFPECPRVGARLDRGSSWGPNRALPWPGFAESDSPRGPDGHNYLPPGRNICARGSDVRLGETDARECIEAAASHARSYDCRCGRSDQQPDTGDHSVYVPDDGEIAFAIRSGDDLQSGGKRNLRGLAACSGEPR